MTMTASERKQADAYAGPGDSFPLYSSGAHLRAAWDLAGHAANPAAVRAKITAFAKKHGLTGMLPKTAKAFDFDDDDGDWDDDGVDAATDTHPATPILDALRRRGSAGGVAPQTSQPVGGEGTGAPSQRLAGTLLPGLSARNTGRAPKEGRRVTRDSTGGVGGPDVPPATMKASRTKQLLETAYNAAERADGGESSFAYDGDNRSKVEGFAQEQGIAHHLPARAHGHMHAAGMPHTHAGTSDAMHQHPVKKAVNVVAKAVTIEKAWRGDDGTCHIEGWVSTEDEDSEHDIVPPEAFNAALPDYAKRRMPLSSEHAMKALPIGHGQRIALVRDGKVFAQATHPTDSAEFESFPHSGTGVYGRFAITEPSHADAVLKGNIGGFSWVGNLREYTPRPGGGRVFAPDSIQPWLESTVAAYPINGKALVLAAKAYEDALGGVQAPAEEFTQVDDTLEKLLAGALEAMQREEAATTPVAEVTKADLEKMFAGLGAKLDAIVEEKVAKAASTSRDGVGRASVVSPASEREDDPMGYIIKKSRAVVKAGEELEDEDKALAWGIFHTFVAQGMKE